MPNLLTIVDRMPPEEVQRWIDTVKERGLATSDATAAELIGKSADTIMLMKRRGADRTTALACAAVLRHLAPFGEAVAEAAAKRIYAVSMPVTITVEVEATSQNDAKAAAQSLFENPSSGALNGRSIPTGEPGESVLIRSAVFEGAATKLRVAEVAA
jgi:hypothetical protein